MALYVFSNDYSVTERVTNETYSGGACVNDALVHAAGEDFFVVVSDLKRLSFTFVFLF